MSDLTDTSTFAGHWPFRDLPVRTPQALKEHLRSKGVSCAWVAPCEAILCPDPMQANVPLLRSIAGDSFFLGVCIINVALATWREDARQCLEPDSASAVKLLPNYHGYGLLDSRVEELTDLAEALGVPVCIQVRMMDERGHHPLMKVPPVPVADIAGLAAGHPGARFLACGAYSAELASLAAVPNVWAELSLIESEQALRSAVGALGPERVVFGSMSPLLYFEAVAAKLDVDPRDVPASVVDRIREGNASQLLGRN
jgi:predicted TIM-barrel fold metal-dependent hydrolase